MSEACSFLTRLIRSRLALETTNFLHRIRDDSERWIPYDKWFKSLDAHDTIITFNYDDVVEHVAERVGRAYPPRGKSVCLEYRSNRPQLIKLHGSVDLFQNSKEPTEIFAASHRNRSHYANCLLDHDVVLGTPVARTQWLVGFAI